MVDPHKKHDCLITIPSWHLRAETDQLVFYPFNLALLILYNSKFLIQMVLVPNQNALWKSITLMLLPLLTRFIISLKRYKISLTGFFP